MKDLCRELNVSMEKCKEIGGEIESLKAEKSAALKSLDELEKELESVKQVNEEIFKEKNLLEKLKSEQQNEIRVIRNEVNELHGNLSLLKESNRDELEKNRQLFSEIEIYKVNLDQVKAERDEAKKTLADEKANGMKLQMKVSEISKKMEETSKVIEELRETGNTLVGERKELEKKYGKLMEDKGIAEKKVTELKARLRSEIDKFEAALGMLKKTALQVSMEKEKNLEEKAEKSIGKRQITDPYLEELEAIRSAFERRGKEMETLKCCVEDAKKQKSFLALVSSATTILAVVVSFAYAASSRAH